MKTSKQQPLTYYTSLAKYFLLPDLFVLAILLHGCADKCEVTNEYIYFEPVYTPLSELRAGVAVTDPQPVKTTGKIYFKDGWLFVNEPGNGIHIIDNHDPGHPVVKKFINIPGNYDLAIKGNTLYADSYVDLVMLDIAEHNNITEVNRLENVFTGYNSLGFYAVNDQVVTDWKEVRNVEVYASECEANVMPWGGILFDRGVAFAADANFSARAAIAPGNGSVSGVGGSMARFTIANDHLYMIDGGDIHALDIATESHPVQKSRTSISWDMETIFPHKNHLFIGARAGMHIVDITTPAQPEFVSTYSHVRVCDPVVVEDDLAFVTLRSGTQCEGFTNQLEVIDISDLAQPQLLHTYSMTNPHGLGIDGNTLFVCDGDDGLKVYDKSDIAKIDENKLAHYRSINAYDVIPFNDILMMIGSDGIYQYDYSDPKDIKFLSHIAVVNESN